MLNCKIPKSAWTHELNIEQQEGNNGLYFVMKYVAIFWDILGDIYALENAPVIGIDMTLASSWQVRSRDGYIHEYTNRRSR